VQLIKDSRVLFMVSPITGSLYLVRRWEHLGGEKFKSLEKKELRSHPLGYNLPGVKGVDRSPKGPLGHEPDDTHTVAAIGYCPVCESNARLTTDVRGVFDCHSCSYQWYDGRVGEQTLEFSDFFSEMKSADSRTASEEIER